MSSWISLYELLSAKEEEGKIARHKTPVIYFVTWIITDHWQPFFAWSMVRRDRMNKSLIFSLSGSEDLLGLSRSMAIVHERKGFL
jgi:hypothetical protein